MPSIVAVEAFTRSQLLLEIHVVSIGEELVELLFVCSMRPLDFAVESGSTGLDVDVLHSYVRHMPVVERLELMAAIRLDRADPVPNSISDAPALLHHLGITRTPGLLEPRLERPIEAEQHVPALAGDRLDPVVVLAVRGFRPEEDVV